MTPQQEIKHKKDRIKLQREWYKTLEKGGFRDIEILGSDGEMLHDLKDAWRFDEYDGSRGYSQEPMIKNQATKEYYDMAKYLLQVDLTQKVFRIPPDREVWELHCDGYTEHQIAELTEYTRDGIHRKIAKYQKLLNVI